MSVFRRTGIRERGVRAALVLLTCLACGDGAEPAERRLVVAEGTMEGVEQFSAVPEMRIDGYEADLVPITWIGVASNGTIAVLQRQDHVVRFFDRSGSPIATVGGEGQGPGEFQRPVRGGWKADTLWVSDPELARVTLISPEGTFVRTLPPLSAARPLPEDRQSLPVFPFVFPYAVYDGDSILLSAMGAAGDPLAEALDGLPLLRTSSDGWIRRVVTVRPRSEGSLQVALPQGGMATAPVPYFPGPHWAVSPDGSLIATVETIVFGGDRGTLTVTLVDETGDQVYRREFPFEGVPIPGHIVDSVLRVRIERARFAEVKRAYETQIRSLVPSVYPPVEDLLVGNDHRTWIGLRPTSHGTPWLVLDEAGAPGGIVTLPANSSIQAADDKHIWAIEQDEFDVESVVRYRLEGQQ